jgi:hypothetical protein
MLTQVKAVWSFRHCAGILMISACFAALAYAGPGSVVVDVPGTSNLWLAGMPDGSTASLTDVAPDQSPALVSGIPIIPGSRYSFSASGQVQQGPGNPFWGPEGNPEWIVAHLTWAENGISELTAPLVSLVGVFLGPDQPDLTPAPAGLNFSTLESRDYLVLAPVLKQPFFIGDGLTSGSKVQQIIAPPGASRLFLGPMDGYEWCNNAGAFSVEVSHVIPAPGAILLGSIGAGMVGWLRKRRVV